MSDLEDLLEEMRSDIAALRGSSDGAETKTVSATLASVTALGAFEGYAAIYGTEDRNGEIIDPGAMTASIRAAGGELPLLLQHDKNSPVGVVRLVEDRRGLKVYGQLAMDSEEGQAAYALMLPPEGFSRAALRDLSIGYLVESDAVIAGVRHLKRISLLEVSLVTVAAHPNTYITSVKSADGALADEDVAVLESLLEEIRLAPLRDMLFEMRVRNAQSFEDLEGALNS